MRIKDLSKCFMIALSLYYSGGLNGQELLLEAENGILEDGTFIGTQYAGYSGSGYVDGFQQRGETLTVPFEVTEAGEYGIHMGYGTPYGGPKNNFISLDGERIADQQFPLVTGYDEIQITEETYYLDIGEHELLVESSWGWFTVDYFRLAIVNGSLPEAEVENILISDEDEDGEMVTLDGSNSSDPDGTIVSYEWEYNGEVIGTESVIMYFFPFGTHQVVLTVTDNDGNTDSRSITVAIADLTNNGHNRLPIRNGEQLKFMSGINIAWTRGSNFARDLTNYVEADWIEILDAIHDAGGNACRWWLHTNGNVSPVFNDVGEVTGLNSNELSNMRKVLDLAEDRGIMISMCLWSFDMLQENAGSTSIRNRNKALLESVALTQTYIDNALIPILQAVGDHPAVMCWEIFNEPEGMTTQFGWSTTRTSMQYVQQFVNLTAGAIHREVPTALVSNGSWSFSASTDVGDGHQDYYSDNELIAAGGDPDGTLDFIQVHYYDHFSVNESPFHNPASHWGIDKPIVIGEFPANGVIGISIEECYELAFNLGYAGAMSWSWSDEQFGGMDATAPALEALHDIHASSLDIAPGTQSPLIVDAVVEVSVFPNPVGNTLIIETGGSPVDKYRVINLKGQIIMEGKVKGVKFEVPITQIPNGLYSLQLWNDQRVIQKKFIKE